MENFNLIVIIIYTFYIVATLGGYVAYKFEVVEARTWEDGVKKFLTLGFHLIYKAYCVVYEELTGKEVSGNSVDIALICSNSEALDLVSALDNHPYETPSLESYVPNVNGSSLYDISAMGFASAYDDLSYTEKVELVCKIIQNYFMSTRNRRVQICIMVLTSKRLYFAVILSDEGRKYLEKQVADTATKPKVEIRKPLTEEIKFPEDSGDKEHDSGIPKN